MVGLRDWAHSLRVSTLPGLASSGGYQVDSASDPNLAESRHQHPKRCPAVTIIAPILRIAAVKISTPFLLTKVYVHTTL